MSNVQRWYIYLISAISLQAVTWASISLLRNLLVFGIEAEAIAFQIAVIVIGLPVFLVHWLWGQRMVRKAIEEYGAVLRRFYLFGSMAAFLEPFISNAFTLFRRLLGGIGQPLRYEYKFLSMGDAVIFHTIALVILAVLWLYHWRVVVEDTKFVPDTGGSATVRRLYVLGFSAVGLSLTTMAVVSLIRWLIQEFGIKGDVPRAAFIDGIPRLVIGITLWLIFWRWSQRLFDGSSEEEHFSALRKFYLYGVIFISAMMVVISASGILASLIRRLLSVGQSISRDSGGDISLPLAIIIGMGIQWIYHAFVLRDDTKKVGEVLRQAEIRRLYLYLIAGVGFSALLVGLSGIINVILRSLDTSFTQAFRKDFAWFTAAIISGLPVWIIPWRQAQAETAMTDSIGKEALRSVVRKIYLYFYLFVATVTVLSSAVYIVYRILSMVLGEEAPKLTELGQSISYLLIAVAVWLYHGSILRGDRQLTRREQAGRLAASRVVILDVGDGLFGKALADHLKRIIPDISLEPIVLSPQAVEEVEEGSYQKTILTQLGGAGLIVAPWMVAVPGSAGGAVSADVAQAVLSSPARKLLVPFHVEGWEWAGVDRWNFDASVRHTVHAVKQVLGGEEVKAHKPLGAGAIIGIIVGVLFLLILLGIAISSFNF